MSPHTDDDPITHLRTHLQNIPKLRLQVRLRRNPHSPVLSCDATWDIIDRVYPELKSEQDKYRLEVYFRETELE